MNSLLTKKSDKNIVYCWLTKTLQQAVQGVCWFTKRSLAIRFSGLPPLGSGRVSIGFVWLGLLSSPSLSVVFRRLFRLGSFTACWRQANITKIQKGQSSSRVANYPPISITPVLYSVWASSASSSSSSSVSSSHQVCISERSRLLWCPFVGVPYTGKYVGEWAGG